MPATRLPSNNVARGSAARRSRGTTAVAPAQTHQCLSGRTVDVASMCSKRRGSTLSTITSPSTPRSRLRPNTCHSASPMARWSCRVKVTPTQPRAWPTGWTSRSRQSTLAVVLRYANAFSTTAGRLTVGSRLPHLEGSDFATNIVTYMSP